MRIFPILRHANLAASLLQYASAVTILSGGTIITYNESTDQIETLRDGSLVITDDRITALLPANTSTTHLPPDAETVNTTGKIIVPGFVDIHHHLWQSLFKTLESNDTLATYFTLFGENGLGETNITPEDSYIGQLAGALESLNAGVTTIVDHAHGLWSNETADAILEANIESGARVFYGYALHNLTNGWTINEQMQKFAELCTAGSFRDTPVSLGLAYDFFSVSSRAEIDSIVNLARFCNASFITSHYLGGQFLVDNSPEFLDSVDILSGDIPVILSHATGITEEGRQLLRDRDQYIATTPESELQLLFDDHNATKLIQDQAGLGVDTNFGFSADLITQARLWLERLRGLNSEPISASGGWASTSPMSVNQAFLLATRQGGLALRRPDLGVIAVGAKADIVVFDTSSPSLLSWRDPVAAVIQHAGIGDIEHVLVDGNFVKRDFRLTHPNLTSIFGQFVTRATQLQDIWIAAPEPDFTGQKYLNVTPYVKTQQIDVIRGAGTGYGDLVIEP